MLDKNFSVNREDYTINAHAQLLNQDVVVNIWGGDVPHIGGIVSYDGKAKKEQEIKFLSHDGRTHKDIFLAERFVEKVKTKLQGNICVTASVHVDGITAKQIEASYSMTDELANQIIYWINSLNIQFKDPKYIAHLHK